MSRLAASFAAILLVLQVLVIQAFAIDPEKWDSLRSPKDPRAYEQVKVRFETALAGYDYPLVFQSLQRDMEDSPLWTKQDHPYQSLLTATRILNERFTHFRKGLSQADNEQALDTFIRSYPTGLFQFPCLNYECLNSPLLNKVTYDELEKLPDEKGADFLYRIETINRLLTDFKSPALKKTVIDIRNSEKRWEMFLHEGMSQYPWEAAFNGWLIGSDSIEFPPERQWILVHPQLGVELYTRSLEDLKVKESLAIEAIGHNWYHWKDRNKPDSGLNWWGVSAAVSLRDDKGPGVGLMAHYGRFLTMGVTWHDDHGKWFDSAPYLIMGIDLFRLAEYKAPIYRKKLEDIQEKKKQIFE